MHAPAMASAAPTTCVHAIETGRARIVHCVSCFKLFHRQSDPIPIDDSSSSSLVGTCPFGRAHVDTPKGDLDASLSVEDNNILVLSGSTEYPYGTSEGFPMMADTAGTVLSHTAHDYMECSNKGLCDREKGQCECLPGYDGVACQRASCPSNANSITPGSGSDERSNIAFKVFNGKTAFTGRALSNAQVNQCSGHGTCMTIEQLAFLDHSNSYDLWDKDASMGCKCDAG
jgi:hypothetical protein